jgi:hypothetical protein
MAIRLQLRAIRDFVAHNNPSVRVKVGGVLDLADANVQSFIRASLGWDAFAVDFLDGSAAIDREALTAEYAAAQKALIAAITERDAANQAYAAAQKAFSDHQAAIIDANDAAAKAEIERRPVDLAEESTRLGELRRAEISARARAAETAAAAIKAGNEAGRLNAQIQGLDPVADDGTALADELNQQLAAADAALDAERAAHADTVAKLQAAIAKNKNKNKNADDSDPK